MTIPSSVLIICALLLCMHSCMDLNVHVISINAVYIYSPDMVWGLSFAHRTTGAVLSAGVCV